jgi:hypothetical protein
MTIYRLSLQLVELSTERKITSASEKFIGGLIEYQGQDLIDLVVRIASLSDSINAFITNQFQNASELENSFYAENNGWRINTNGELSKETCGDPGGTT